MATLSLFVILLIFAFVFFLIDSFGGIKNVNIKWYSFGCAFVVLAFIANLTKIGG